MTKEKKAGMTREEKKCDPGVDFCDDGKSQQTNQFKSLNLLYGVGLHGIHGFLQHLFLTIFNFFMGLVVFHVIY